MAEEKLSVNQISAILESQQQKVDDSKRKKTVCVHWLNGQCKKGDNCEYLHVYQEDKIPPCKYFLQEGQCQKGDKCVYRHINAAVERRTEDCPYYERGFCKLNFIYCGLNHIHKKICENYTYGFCPLGPECDKAHVKSIVADSDSTLRILANFPEEENWSDKTAMQPNQFMIYQKPMVKVRCHRCGLIGHKSTYCQEEQITQEELNKILAEDDGYNLQNSTVLCFKCKRYGHYANVCPMKAQNQQQNQDQMGLGGLKLTAGLQQFNQLIEKQQQNNPSGDIFNQPNNHHNDANMNQAYGGDKNYQMYEDHKMSDAMMSMGMGMGIQQQQQHQNHQYGQQQQQDARMGSAGTEGGNQSDLAQSLKNIQKLFDKDSNISVSNPNNDNIHDQQLQQQPPITVTQVSLHDLPLAFEQINNAVFMCVQQIQQPGLAV